MKNAIKILLKTFKRTRFFFCFKKLFGNVAMADISTKVKRLLNYAPLASIHKLILKLKKKITKTFYSSKQKKRNVNRHSFFCKNPIEHSSFNYLKFNFLCFLRFALLISIFINLSYHTFFLYINLFFVNLPIK